VSTNTPSGDDPSNAESLDFGTGEPIGSEPGAPSRRRRVGLVAGGVAAVVLAGGGAWAWSAWFNQGAQPAEALPGNTLAYVAVDLDPTGQQKVEAIEVLRKFPAFKDKIGLDTDDDVRRKVFELIQEDGTCEDLDYAKDVEPWLGQRAAFAVVSRGEETPAPVAVVQVTDEDKAVDGLEALAACDSDDESADGDFSSEGGYAIADGWAVLAETEQIAEGVVADAKDSGLADDEEFQSWTQAAGDPGVVTLYAAPEAGKAMLDFAGDDLLGMGSELSQPSISSPDVDTETMDQLIADLESRVAETAEGPERDALEAQLQMFQQMRDEAQGDFGDAAPPETGEEEVPEELEKAMAEFPGMAGVVRFADGDVELEFAGGVTESALMSYDALGGGDRGDDVLATLPESTAVAFGLGFGEGWGQAWLDQMAPMLESMSGMGAEDAIAELETQTGLKLPEDLETLVGESLAIAVDDSIDAGVLGGGDPSGVPAGIKIKGDPEAIEEVLDKIRAQMGEAAQFLVSRTEGDHVLVAPNTDYLETLAEDGGLGDTDTFGEVVPEAEDSAVVFFVDFDANNWLDELVGSFGDDEVSENVAPLRALGVSSWLDGDESHSLVRLTTE
jgi:hypothetical protein